MLSFLNIFTPFWWCITIVGNFLMDSLVIISISSFYNNRFTMKTFKRNILKVWLFNLYADIIALFYLIMLSLLFSNAEYYEGNNIFKLIESGIYLANCHSFFSDFFSVSFIASGVFLGAIAVFFVNYSFSFSEENISKKMKKNLCITLSITTAPYYIFLLEH